MKMPRFMSNYIDFAKRALKFRNLYFTRKEYWSFVGLSLLFFLILYALGSLITNFLVGTLNMRSSSTTITNIVVATPCTVFMIFFTLVGFLGEIGRLHNSGRSGLNLLWVLLPYIGSIIVLIFLCSREVPVADNEYAPEYLKYPEKSSSKSSKTSENSKTSKTQNIPKRIRSSSVKDPRHYGILARKVFNIETAFAKDYIQIYARTHQLKPYAKSTMLEIAPITFYLYAYGLILANRILRQQGKEDEQEIMLTYFTKTRKHIPTNAYEEALRTTVPAKWRKKALKKTLEGLVTNDMMKEVVDSMTPMLTEAFDNYYNQVEIAVEQWSENEF